MVGRRLLESFLRLCGFSWRAFSRAEGVTLPAPISDLECLSRYITDQGHFNAPKETIHFRAFLPKRQDQDLSIMRTDQLTEAAVWTLGDQEVGEPSGRAISARGDFVAPSVREAVVDPWALTVEPSEPPVRHALIVGWPPGEEAEIRKSLAQQLRAKAKLHVRGDGANRGAA